MTVTIIALNEKTWQIDIKEEYHLNSISRKKVIFLKENFSHKHLLKIHDWHSIKVLKNKA